VFRLFPNEKKRETFIIRQELNNIPRKWRIPAFAPVMAEVGQESASSFDSRSSRVVAGRRHLGSWHWNERYKVVGKIAPGVFHVRDSVIGAVDPGKSWVLTRHVAGDLGVDGPSIDVLAEAGQRALDVPNHPFVSWLREGTMGTSPASRPPGPHLRVDLVSLYPSRGVTLASVLSLGDGPPLSASGFTVGVLTRVFAQTLVAVDHLHAHSVSHGALSPDTIWLVPAGDQLRVMVDLGRLDLQAKGPPQGGDIRAIGRTFCLLARHIARVSTPGISELQTALGAAVERGREITPAQLLQTYPALAREAVQSLVSSLEACESDDFEEAPAPTRSTILDQIRRLRSTQDGGESGNSLRSAFHDVPTSSRRTRGPAFAAPRSGCGGWVAQAANTRERQADRLLESVDRARERELARGI